MRTAIVYNFLLEATLMASIAILLMIPIRRFLRRQLGSRALCFGWLLVAVRLLCPLALPNPLIASIRSGFSDDMAIRPIAGQIQVRFSDAAFEAYQWARGLAGRDSGLAQSMGRLVDSTGNGMLSIRLMQLYVLGVAAVLGWFLYSNVRFRRRLRADRIEPVSGKLLEEYHALCARMSVKPLPLWYVDPLPSACLVGVFRPYIALPLTAAPGEVVQVLTHEMCHQRGRDHWWGALRLACCAVHWFNPLVWLAAHMSCTDIELACDDRVIDKLNPDERKAYAGVLVLAAARRDLPGLGVLSTGMSMTGRKLKKRVSAILRGSQTSRGLAMAFVMLASMALVGAFATAEYFPLPAAPRVDAQPAAAPIPTPVLHKEALENQQEIIAYAQQIWQSDYVQQDCAGYTWSAYKLNGHYEVLGADAQGNPQLMSAFLPDGQMIYLCNMASGDRDALATDAPRYEAEEHSSGKMRQFAMEAVKALVPAMQPPIQALGQANESAAGENRFFSFHETNDQGEIIRSVRIQIVPQVRMTYLIDENHFTFDDADRLEPGNG